MGGSQQISPKTRREEKRIKLHLHTQDFLHETINARVMIMPVQE